MMINKRLIKTVHNSKKYIIANVIFQWISLLSNIFLILTVSNLIEKIYNKEWTSTYLYHSIFYIVLCIILRFICTILSTKMSYLSSKEVKKTLRAKIYEKLLRLGSSYRQNISTSEIVQVAVEGVDQLETYFGAYLPQFFYSMLAPLTLFIALSFISFSSALVLFLCVPLIPITIAAVQTFAKKLLAKYWGQYTTLGDTFLENLQGLTTLKIYQTDERKNQEMNRESENFRKITMKVLSMQLNSIIIMDIIAYGGAALGIIMAVNAFGAEKTTLAGALSIILLSADFFIPMRMLGSFFHIAMNGMAASDKIFRLLDLEENQVKNPKPFPTNKGITVKDLQFSYDGERTVLNHINASFPICGLTAIVGESGCGKSTIASILSGKIKGYEGDVCIGSTPVADVSRDDLTKNITYIGFDSYLFSGTIRENLLMGNPYASDQTLWNLLEKVRLADFLHSEQGLDTVLTEKASNLSGGQRQRLALARAILHDSPFYIFDEATSNIDVESENTIIQEIKELSKTKSVIFITHRLANAETADMIYAMENGQILEQGSHSELLKKQSLYFQMWTTQNKLEHFTKEDN